MKRVLVLGATSAIAQATARLFASAGDALFVVARDESKLAVIADDLRLRGASKVASSTLDVLDYDRHQETIDAAIEALGGLDVVLIAHGSLPDQQACERSFDISRREFEVNALSTVSFLTRLANYFEDRGEGTIAVISSVAGDRGRQSNYVYGSAKGMLTIFLQGLRNRLHRSGVSVVTIKPGFVDTPMTDTMRKGFLWSDAGHVADDIYKAVQKRKSVSYTPGFWRLIMLVIKSIPEFLFKRLRL